MEKRANKQNTEKKASTVQMWRQSFEGFLKKEMPKAEYERISLMMSSLRKQAIEVSLETNSTELKEVAGFVIENSTDSITYSSLIEGSAAQFRMGRKDHEFFVTSHEDKTYCIFSADAPEEKLVEIAKWLCMGTETQNKELLKFSAMDFQKAAVAITAKDKKSEQEELYNIKRRKTDEERISSDSPYVQLFADCLRYSRDNGISDIHFERRLGSTVIRMHRHGNFFKWKTVAQTYAKPFFDHVKKCCNLSLGITRTAQDTRISLPSWKLDVRVNCMPTLHGERVVLRLLDLRKSFDLSTAGFSKTNLHALQSSLQHKNGLILVTGPTGSGKTTTLYSMLCELDHNACNIITIENPVEYSFPGISQVQVGEKFSFADAIKAILRQDPDVILVGEIRDQVTAKLCLEASATGHLVLSTLHTNGATEAVSRLVGLGAEKEMIAENLRFCATQTLVPVLCKPCKGKGCDQCAGGTVGRQPDIEFLEEDQIRSFIDTGKTPSFRRLPKVRQKKWSKAS